MADKNDDDKNIVNVVIDVVVAIAISGNGKIGQLPLPNELFLTGENWAELI